MTLRARTLRNTLFSSVAMYTEFALGMLAGVMAYVELTPGIDDWIKANAQGEMTLPSVTGLSMGWFALAFIAFLVFAGWGMKQLEGKFGHLRPGG